MNREQIIQMAREAGNMRINDYYTNGVVTAFSDEQLEAFAKLVAEHERSECAKRLDAVGCDHCATNIRARGQA